MQNTRSLIKGLQIAIDNRLREDTDITAELKILAAGYRKFYETETRRLKEKLDIAANRVKALKSDYQSLRITLEMLTKRRQVLAVFLIILRMRYRNYRHSLEHLYQRQELSYVKMRLKNMISHSGIKNC